MSHQSNPTSTAPYATGPQTEGVDQAPTGFNKDGDITQQQDAGDVAPTATQDGTEAEGQKQQGGGPGGKLRSVFGRSKKGSDEVEGQGKGDEESAPKQQ